MANRVDSPGFFLYNPEALISTKEEFSAMRLIHQPPFLAFRRNPNIRLDTALKAGVTTVSMEWTSDGWRTKFHGRSGIIGPAAGILVHTHGGDTRAEDLQVILSALFEGGWWMINGNGHDPAQSLLSFLAVPKPKECAAFALPSVIGVSQSRRGEGFVDSFAPVDDSGSDGDPDDAIELGGDPDDDDAPDDGEGAFGEFTEFPGEEPED